MFKQISLKAMCKYEALTGKNAMELFQKDGKSATDLRDMVFIIKYSTDQTVTLDIVENYSSEEFQSAMDSINKV